MDNWVIFILVNVVLALLVSVFGGFINDWIKSSYQKRLLFSRQKKIDKLKSEYRLKKLLHILIDENSTHYLGFIIRIFVTNLLGFVISITTTGFLAFWLIYFFNTTFVRLFYVSYFILSIGYYAYKELKETIDFISDSITFSSYEVEAKKEMKN